MNISIDRINGRDNRTNGQQWQQTNGETSLERARKNNGKIIKVHYVTNFE